MTIYFDGSQGPDDNGTNWLTLAGLMAPEHVWKEFRREWNHMLVNRDPAAPYIHMRDLHTGNGPFKRAHGWGTREATALTSDALQVIQAIKFCYKACIFAVGIRVNLDAHESIVSKGMAIYSPHEICVRASVASMLKRFCDTLREESIETWNIAFDQGERFLHPFKKEWDRNRTKGLIKKHLFWDLILDVQPLDSKKEPGLQAADMFAWSSLGALCQRNGHGDCLAGFSYHARERLGGFGRVRLRSMASPSFWK